MTDALACDGPDCAATATSPYIGWWQVENLSLVVTAAEPHRLHFCSWGCVGAFVMAQAGTVRELERRLEET